MHKKCLLSLSLAGFGCSKLSEAIKALPPVQEFGVDKKLEAKKKKKAEREAKRRAKRLEKLNTPK